MLAHPDGTEVLVMKRRGFLSPIRELCEPSGRVLAVLQKEEGDWFILDADGTVVARTTTTVFQARYCEFTTSIQDSPVARYVWRQVWFRPEMQVEFSDSAAARLDRRIGIALATVLEGKARISTYRYFGN
jgi:hypothetical protein